MSIIIIKSRHAPLGRMAYENRYKREAVFKDGKFLGFVKKVEAREAVAFGATLGETLSKAIKEKITCKRK